jgi:hypothetical protein
MYHDDRGVLGQRILPSEGSRESKEIVGLLTTVSQVLAMATAALPLVRVVFEGVRKGLGFVFRRGKISVMDTYNGKNCRVRTLAYAVTDNIIDLLQSKPGGYSFWASLPRRGRNNTEAIRKKIADTLLSGFYNSTFISVLLRSALDENGKPTSGPLYQWLLTHVYSDNIKAMYKDWLRVSHGEDVEDEG